MFQEFPYTDMHQLNLDWIIKIAKDFLDQYTHLQQLITEGEESITNKTAEGVESITNKTAEGVEELQAKADNLEALLNAWYSEHSEDIATQLASALADLNNWYTLHQGYLDQKLTDNIALFTAQATAIGNEVIESIPEDYTDLSQIFNLNTLLPLQASFNPYAGDMTGFDTGTSLSGDLWFNNKVYGAGLVKSITLRYADETTTNNFTAICIIDPATYTVIDKIVLYRKSLDKQITYKINRVYDQDIYIGLYTTIPINYRANTDRNSYYASSTNVNIGTVLSPTLSGTVEFPFIVEYQPVDVGIGQLIKNNIAGTFTYAIQDRTIDSYPSAIGANWWASEYHFPKGYVKRINYTKSNADAEAHVAIIDLTTNMLVFKAASQNSYIDVEQYIDHDFVVFIKNVKYNTAVTQWQKYCNTQALDSINVGSYWEPTFSNGGYIFAFELVYEFVNKTTLKNKTGYNRLFVCGDSITAGFPYIANHSPYAENPSVKYGNQIAEALGFDVTFGAQSGNGWVYSTGSENAYTITRDTDFSNYDVAIYEWGTNDYGHDAALGDITDDPAQVLTVCSRIKWCINKIMTDNNKCTVILILPLIRKVGTFANKYAYGTSNTAGWTLNDLCEKMIQICNMYGISYIDTRNCSINAYTIDGFLSDGLHPSELGYWVLGAFLTGQVENIIKPYTLPFLTK